MALARRGEHGSPNVVGVHHGGRRRGCRWVRRCGAVRFDRYPRYLAQATKQRLAAAKRAIQRERDAVPLFPELAPQETPEERIARVDAEVAAYWQRMRDHRAKQWRKARRWLYSMPEEQRKQILAEWETCQWPGSPEYLLTFMRWWLNGKRWWYVRDGDDPWRAAFAKDEPVKRDLVVGGEQLRLFEEAHEHAVV